MLPVAPEPSTRRRESNSGALYPSFDSSPYAAIDYGDSLDRQGSAQTPLPVPQVEQDMNDLRTNPPSLMDSQMVPAPSYGPTLGPQELEVMRLTPASVSCCCKAAFAQVPHKEHKTCIPHPQVGCEESQRRSDQFRLFACYCRDLKRSYCNGTF